jgi:asparagine synthase (glutamine-hydrolysing)
MCGIGGIYFFDQRPVPENSLRAMAKALAHRGPDEEGIFSQHRVGLVSRRLRIIDLSKDASQPMQDKQKRCHIVFNGEIYNFRELRKELESRHNFFSKSDTEVVLRLFMEQREGCWKILNGMFAAALYDSESRELFLARDHAGIKPLYYYANDHCLVFASELKAIFATELVPREINISAITEYLRLGYFPGEWTPYRNIRKLKPGNYCKVNSDGIEIQKYWSPRETLRERKTDVEPSQIEDALDCLLQSSVEAQMVSDVPVGAFLSGGIDSSLIVALMSSLSKKRVQTFTVGFSRMGYYDEREHARQIADHFKTEHHEYSVDAEIEDLLPRLIETFDEPFADSSAVPTFCLAELAKKQVTVALSGTGGDEIFGGYRKYMAAQWSGIFNSLPDSIRRGVQKTAAILPASRKSLWQERALLFQRFTSLPSDEPAEIQFNSIFARNEIQELLQLESAVPPLEFEAESKSAAQNLMLFDLEYYLPEDLLVKEDRCTMAFGLEARVPYLDRDLIEFMLPLPLKYKVSGGATKKLFRKVAARYLPESILKRPKHGFGSPAAEWLRGKLKSLAQETLFSSKALLNSRVVEQKFADHTTGKADHNRGLWAILMLELWYSQQRSL